MSVDSRSRTRSVYANFPPPGFKSTDSTTSIATRRQVQQAMDFPARRTEEHEASPTALLDAVANGVDALRRARRSLPSPAPASRPPPASRRFAAPTACGRRFARRRWPRPKRSSDDPKLVWEWYDWRRQVIRDAQPNAAHDVLARWTRERPEFTLITQNVDGLHERAGAERLIRLPRLDLARPLLATVRGRRPLTGATKRAPYPNLPPRCPHCGGLLRPGVVWFGEGLDPADVIAAADAAALRRLPDHRHVVGRLSRRRPRPSSQTARRVDD